MGEDESPEQQNLRLAVALLDNDERALEEILRLYGPDILESLHNKFTKRMGVLRYEDIEDVVSVALGGCGMRGPITTTRRSRSASGSTASPSTWRWTCSSTAGTKPGDLRGTSGRTTSKKSCRRRSGHPEPKIATQTQAVERGVGPPTRTEQIAGCPTHDRHGRFRLSRRQRVQRIPGGRTWHPCGACPRLPDRAYATIRREMRKLGHEIPEPRKDKP